MQVRLISLLVFGAAVLVFVAICAGEVTEKFSFSFNTYSDDANTDIYQTNMGLTKKVSDRFALDSSLAVDAVSSATPLDGEGGDDEEDEETDAVSGATRSADSQRYSGSLGVIYDYGDDNVEVGGYYSHEDAYNGRTVYVNYTRLLNLENTELGAGASYSFDEWKVSGVDDGGRNRVQINLSAMQLISPESKVQLTYTNTYSDGYLASPYRSVEIGGTTVDERLPDERAGHALKVSYVRLLSPATSMNVSYRYYFDNWEIDSHTANLELYRDLTENLVLGGRYRYYTQSAASFTKPPGGYTLSDRYVAVDYTYSDFDSNTAGLVLMYRPQWERFIDWDKVKLKLSADYYWTSDNEHIDAVYDRGSLSAVFTSMSLEYEF